MLRIIISYRMQKTECIHEAMLTQIVPEIISCCVPACSIPFALPVVTKSERKVISDTPGKVFHTRIILRKAILFHQTRSYDGKPNNFMKEQVPIIYKLPHQK